jgi:hypothetical protein
MGIDDVVRATLKRGAERLAFGAPVSLDPAGLVVELDVPPGVELERAELRMEAPDDRLELDAALAVTTSAGPLDPNKPVEWVSVDLGARRPLTWLEIDTDAKAGRLKVSEGGPWFPPQPFEIIDLRAGVRLSGVTATRLLVEPIEDTKSDKKERAPARIRGVKARVAARPPDLRASIADGPPFFGHPLLLAPGEVVLLRDELTAALRRAWPADLAGGLVTVTVRSSAESRLRSVRLALATSAVFRAWDGGAAEVTLSIPPGGVAETSVRVPGGRPLESIAFTVQSRPRPETVPLLPEPRTDPVIAQLAGSGFGVAQAFSTPAEDAALLGINLFLQPLTPAVKGTVSIHPDVFGRPADAPFAKAVVELAIEDGGGAPRPPRWVDLDFAGPVPVKNGVFWAVLDVLQGDALWLLGDAPEGDPKATTELRGTLFRSAGERVWREREPPPSFLLQMPHPWACARPRFRATTPPPAPRITLLRGSAEVPAVIGKGGRVALDARALEALSRDGDERLRVAVRSDVAAEVTLSGLRVRVPSTHEHPPS